MGLTGRGGGGRGGHCPLPQMLLEAYSGPKAYDTKRRDNKLESGVLN